jgi:hypothetical protein
MFAEGSQRDNLTAGVKLTKSSFRAVSDFAPAVSPSLQPKQAGEKCRFGGRFGRMDDAPLRNRQLRDCPHLRRTPWATTRQPREDQIRSDDAVVFPVSPMESARLAPGLALAAVLFQKWHRVRHRRA